MEIKDSFFHRFKQPLEEMRLEPVFCNLCGSEHYKLLGKEYVFEIRECGSCGLVYVSPQPCLEDLPKFYEDMFASDTERSYEAYDARRAVMNHLRRIVVRRGLRQPRLLEAGCGYGLFLQHVNSVASSLTGTEVSAPTAESARQRNPQAHIVTGTLEAIDFPTASFDCIVLIAVFEHLKDPKSILEKLHGWLAPGGLIILQVPYVQTFIRLKRWIPSLPISFEAPRHLFDYSPKTLPRYLEECGFQSCQVEISRPYYSDFSLHSFLIWAVKSPGLLLHWLTCGRYVFPFACGIVAHALKK